MLCSYRKMSGREKTTGYRYFDYFSIAHSFMQYNKNSKKFVGDSDKNTYWLSIQTCNYKEIMIK